MNPARYLTSRLPLILAIAAMAVAFYLSGCGDRCACVTVEPETEVPGRESRNGILDFCVYAVENENIAMCAEALDDRFLFVFTIAESIGLPADEPWWGKTLTLEWLDSLFCDTTVESIGVDLGEDPTWYWCQIIRQNAGPDPPDTIQCFACRLSPVFTWTVAEPGQDSYTQRYHDSWLDVFITADPCDADLFCVVQIEETPIPGGSVATPVATRPVIGRPDCGVGDLPPTDSS